MKRFIPILRVMGIALPLLAIVLLIQWHPMWAIWVAVGFVGFNALLFVGLIILSFLVVRKERREAANSTMATFCEDEGNDD